MSRTTGQWEQLLEGATPGPWEHDGESGVRGPRETDDLGRGPALLAAMQMPHRQPRKRHNAALMAAAPEAVAEVIRLRRELEELKRKTGSLTLSAELLAGDHPIHREALNGAANEFRELQETITNILDQEGN